MTLVSARMDRRRHDPASSLAVAPARRSAAARRASGQSLALSLVLQVGDRRARLVGAAALRPFRIGWVNSLIRWLGGAAVVVLALMLFPASFGIVISIFMERIADIVEARHYPAARAGARHPDLDRHLDRPGVPGRGGGAEPGDAAVLHRRASSSPAWARCCSTPSTAG